MFEDTSVAEAPDHLKETSFEKTQGKIFMSHFPKVAFDAERIYATFNENSDVSAVIRVERLKALAGRLRKHNDVDLFAKAYEEAPNLGVVQSERNHNNLVGVSEIFGSLSTLVDRGLKEPWLLTLTPYKVSEWFHDIITNSSMIFGPQSEDLLLTVVGERPEWLKENANFTASKLTEHLGDAANLNQQVPGDRVRDFFEKTPLPLSRYSTPGPV